MPGGFQPNNNAVAFDERGVLAALPGAEATRTRYHKLAQYVTQVLVLRDDGMSDRRTVEQKVSYNAYQFLTRLLAMGSQQMTDDERRYYVALIDMATLMCAKMTSVDKPRDRLSIEAWEAELYHALRTLANARDWQYPAELQGRTLLKQVLADVFEQVFDLAKDLADPDRGVTAARKNFLVVAKGYVKFTSVLLGVYASLVPDLPEAFAQLRANIIEMAKAQRRFDADILVESTNAWKEYEDSFEANRPGAERDLRQSGIFGDPQQ